MNKNKIMSIIQIIASILFFILAVLIVYQIVRSIIGGSWTTENIIVSLVILNLTTTLILIGYIYKLNNKISAHLGWHKGYENGKQTK